MVAVSIVLATSFVVMAVILCNFWAAMFIVSLWSFLMRQCRSHRHLKRSVHLQTENSGLAGFNPLGPKSRQY